MRDHLISPFTTGYEGTAIESLYPSNTDMFRKAKAQGARRSPTCTPSAAKRDPLEGGLGVAKGYMVDAALGTTDAVEWSGAGRAGFYPWYATLNNGLRITAIGGEDSISNLHRSKLVGSVRTYVYTGARGLTCTPGSKGFGRSRLCHHRSAGGVPRERSHAGRRDRAPASGGTVDVQAQCSRSYRRQRCCWCSTAT